MLFWGWSANTDSWWFECGFWYQSNDSVSNNIYCTTNSLRVKTTNVFSSTTDWYHILIALDTAKATDSDRLKVYVNWVDQNIPAFSILTPNFEAWVNQNTVHMLWKSPAFSWRFFDWYMADVNFVDGIALAPESFGANVNWVWSPVDYTGDFGTNWFNLDFNDSTNVGKDSTTNWNDWLAAEGVGKTITVNGNTNHSTTASKFWTSSVYFDWNDALTLNDSAFAFWTWDFTIEYWHKHDSFYNYITLFGTTRASSGYSMWTQGSSYPVFYVHWSWEVLAWPHNTYIANTWHHTAFVRHNWVLKVYVDGVEKDSANNTSNFTQTYTVIWALAWTSSTIAWEHFTGYVDEMRVSDVARYTTAFTPQTTKFERDANTKLLIHSDNTNWDTSIKDSSVAGSPNGNDLSIYTPTQIKPKLTISWGGNNKVTLTGTNQLYINDGRTSWVKYQNLPSYMIWTVWTDKINWTNVSLTLDKSTTCYLLRSEARDTVDLTWWENVSSWEHYFSESNASWVSSIYKKVLAAWTYSLDVQSAMYACDAE